MSCVALRRPKSMRPVLRLTQICWPDGRSFNILDDRRASVFVAISWSAILLSAWFVGRTGQYGGEIELDRRLLLLMALFAGVIVSFATWARTKRSFRFAGDTPPRLWASVRWPDGRRVGVNEDPAWGLAQFALLVLAVVLLWAAGRVGFPTQVGSGLGRTVLVPILMVGGFAGAAGAVRLRSLARCN